MLVERKRDTVRTGAAVIFQRMVSSFLNTECGSESVSKTRRISSTCASPEGLAFSEQRHSAPIKQKLMSKLSDSGFEEDLVSCGTTWRFWKEVSHLGSNKPDLVEVQLSNWYLQYGDVGFQIQKEKEAQFHTCQSLERQPQLTAEARCKLVSWLIPVHKHFRLSFECCCLTVNIMDRFLASTPLAADCFQLLGVTALLLASKQVEICTPPVSQLLSLCCDAFTKEQLCNLECLILLRLNFRLVAPTLAFFLDYFISSIEASQQRVEKNSSDKFSRKNPAASQTRKCNNLAQRVCELTLADYAFNRYPPSLTASCALTLASEMLKVDCGVAENATFQSQVDKWDSFTDELYTQPVARENPECSDDLLSINEVNFYSLVQECKDSLKLLVSLNQETLELMSTV